MGKKALVHETRICQIEDEDDIFEVSSDLSWVDVDDDTTTKDTYVDDAVVKYTIPLASYWDSLRQWRDSKLASSDWRVMPDSPLSDSDKEKWVAYRTKLRNFPSTLNDTTVKESITWLDEPS